MWSVVARKRRRMKRREEEEGERRSVCWRGCHASFLMVISLLQSSCSHLVCLLIHAEHFLGYPDFQPVRTAHFSTDLTLATGNEEKTDTTGNAGIGWARCSGGDKPAAWKLSVFIIYSWPRRQAGESRYKVFVGQWSQAAVPREEEAGTFCIQQTSLLIRGKSCYSHVSETLRSLTWRTSPYIISPGWFVSTKNSTGLMM